MPDANGNLLPEDKRTGLISAASTPGQSITTYAPEQVTAATATGRGYTPKTVTVGENDTVQGQLNKITATDSPLMKQAERRARDEVAPRGLLNSSLAVGHAQEAVIASALPIAQQDATTYFGAKTKSVDAENAALNFGANADNQASIVNAQLLNDASKFNAGAKNEAAARAAQDANAAALARLDASTRMDIARLDATTRKDIAQQDVDTRLRLGQQDADTRMALGRLDADTRMSAAQLESQTSIRNAELQAETARQNAQMDASTRLQLGQLDASTRMSAAQLDAQTRTQVAQMDAATQSQIAAIQNRNRELLQANQNAANMMNTASNAITNISIQPNLSPGAKKAAIDTQLNLLNEGLRTTGDVAGLDLSSYFQTPAMQADTNADGRVTIDNMDRERYLAENPGVVNAWQDYNTRGRYEGAQAYALPS